MKRTISLMLILLSVVFLSVNVKASSWDEIYITVEKGESSRVLYNSMPTEIKRNDEITVKLMVKNISGWKPLTGESELTWDDKAFEPVEVNGKYYQVISDKINNFAFTVTGSNKANMQYTWTNFIADENTIAFVEFKFKVKNTVSDGVYKIRLNPKSTGDISVYGSGNYYSTFATDQPLQYLIGKPKISSKYTKTYLDSLDNSLYIIGNHMFNREVNDEYDGVLRTEYIMLAAKTIASEDKDDMIIYYKDLDGEWKNAITNVAIDNLVPEDFEITNINLKANYIKNGVYANSGDTTILRLIQVSADKAIVTIENEKEKIHGVATVEGENIVFTVGNKNYSIAVGDDSATITTNDTNITTTSLDKRANVTIENYFNSEYAWLNYESDTASHYLRSEHTGRYNKGNYELNFLRISEDTARICLKEKNSDDCLMDFNVSSAGNSDDVYSFGTTEATYNFTWNENINISCTGACVENYKGDYTKEKGLSMQDVFDVWEKNRVKYSVTFVENETTSRTIYVTPGESLNDVNEYYIPYKHNWVFVEWQLNGQKFEANTPINEPITLEALFRQIPGIPELSISPQGDGHDYYNYENDTFYYHFTIETEDDFDGFTIYDSTTLPIQTVVKVDSGIVADISLALGESKTFYARTYIEVGGEKYYGNSSNEITLNPVMYEVSFNTSGGTEINPVSVPYGGTIERPDPDPNKKYFVFSEWQLDGQTFDFDTPISANITLDAVWTANIPVPVIGDNTSNNYYEHSLYLANENAYCDKQGGGCNVSHTQYAISSYEVYIKNVDHYDYVTAVLPYENYDFVIEPNEVRTYVIRVIYGENEGSIPSGYSEEYTIDSTIPIPEIIYNNTLAAPDGDYDLYKWIDIDNLNSNYGFGCVDDTCAGYKVDGFKLYDYDGEIYNYIDTYDVGESIPVTLNFGEEKHPDLRYAVRNSDGFKFPAVLESRGINCLQ